MCTSMGETESYALCVCGARMLVCVCVCERERERWQEREMTGERNRRVKFHFNDYTVLWRQNVSSFSPSNMWLGFGKIISEGGEINEIPFSCQDIWLVSVSATLFCVLKHLAGLSVSATRAGPYQPVYSEPAYALHGEASREHVQGIRYRHLHQDSTETRRLQSLRGALRGWSPKTNVNRSSTHSTIRCFPVSLDFGK